MAEFAKQEKQNDDNNKMKNDKWDYNKISFVKYISVTQTQYSLIIIVLSNRNAMCDNVLSQYLVIY